MFLGTYHVLQSSNFFELTISTLQYIMLQLFVTCDSMIFLIHVSLIFYGMLIYVYN
jgi:hypothetical protein